MLELKRSTIAIYHFFRSALNRPYVYLRTVFKRLSSLCAVAMNRLLLTEAELIGCAFQDLLAMRLSGGSVLGSLA